MKLQLRDIEILKTIAENGGFITRRHIQVLHFPNKSPRRMEQRLSILHEAEYIEWPTRQQRRTKPIPEPIIWLGWKGIFKIAGLSGVAVETPQNINETQLRIVEKQLRDHGIPWAREPRWSLLEHDIAVTDFKYSVIKAIEQLPTLNLGQWIPERIFRAEPDKIPHTLRKPDGTIGHAVRRVIPDGYLEVEDEHLRVLGQNYRVRFLLEIDMATHDNPSFGREKVAPGIAYIKSRAYKVRFGYNSGRWLVVISGGQTRLRNLMRQTEFQARENASLFFFTYLQEAITNNVITSPIWYQVGSNEPVALLS